jgi:ArsR family transcriptional regulator
MDIDNAREHGRGVSIQDPDAVFKALASGHRREILGLLARGVGDDTRCCSDEEVCACVFSERLGIGAPTISHHMKVLTDAGLVTSEKRGQWVYYRLQPGALARAASEVLAIEGCPAEGCR